MYEVERKIEVEWAKAVTESFLVKLVIYTDDRPGMLNQLTSALFNEGTNIRTLEAQPDASRSDGSALVNVAIDVKDKKQLERIVSSLRRISGVRDVERSQSST
jgi:GTP pyrophosphokinase